MKRSVVALAGALLALALATGSTIAVGPPAPEITGTCDGSWTTGSWKYTEAEAVQFSFYDVNNNHLGNVDVVPDNTNQHKGSVTIQTPRVGVGGVVFVQVKDSNNVWYSSGIVACLAA